MKKLYLFFIILVFLSLHLACIGGISDIPPLPTGRTSKEIPPSRESPSQALLTSSQETTSSTTTPHPTHITRQMTEVHGDQGWQNTGITVRPGDLLTIRYFSGEWSPWGGGSCDGRGMPDTDPVINNIVTGVLHASLIGRVDAQNPFYVGNEFSQMVDHGGEVFLRINDTVLEDNSGEINASIEVTRFTGSASSSFEVFATNGWQSTGIPVEKGATVTIQVVSGQWTYIKGDAPYNSGEGGEYICGNFIDSCVEPLPSFPSDGLIGRIGGFVFGIGNGMGITTSQSGILDLRINDGDDGLFDNDGSLVVEIRSSVPLYTEIPTPEYLEETESEITEAITFIPTQPPSGSALLEKVVFTVAYIDAPPLNDIEAHQNELIIGLRNASIWHGYDNPNGIPALQYKTYEDSIIRVSETLPHRLDNDKFDYAAFYERFDLCRKIQDGLIDEVWIWESGTGHAWEWVTNGPNWSWTWGANVPNCGRTITTLNFNYQREIDVAFESFGHRLEGAFMTHYPCDFFTESWPWVGWPSQCKGKVSDRFGFVARAFSGNSFISVCGDVHHPPNILDNREYIYNDTITVKSICKDWQWDGAGQVRAFDCQEWGCTERGYLVWWMQNLPGYGNSNSDRDGDLMPNWWESLFR